VCQFEFLLFVRKMTPQQTLITSDFDLELTSTKQFVTADVPIAGQAMAVRAFLMLLCQCGRKNKRFALAILCQR
jgi:hypothetical protein